MYACVCVFVLEKEEKRVSSNYLVVSSLHVGLLHSLLQKFLEKLR